MGKVIPILEWLPLDSSAVRAAAYSKANRTLYLEFESGEVYRYFDFPPECFHEFLAAGSKGNYFAQNIRTEFTHEHVPLIRPKTSPKTRRAGK